MLEIRRIEKKSLARIVALFYGLAGAGVFLAITVFSLIDILAGNEFAGSIVKDVLFNLGLGLVLSAGVGTVAGLFGYVLGFIWAMIYNLAALKIGGIKIEMREKEEGQKEIKLI